VKPNQTSGLGETTWPGCRGNSRKRAQPPCFNCPGMPWLCRCRTQYFTEMSAPQYKCNGVMEQSAGFSQHPECQAAPKLLLRASHRPHKQGQSQDTPTPSQLRAGWLDTNREAPSRMWEGCSTLICRRSAAGGRRNRKGSDQLFLSQGTPSTPPPPTSLPPPTMAGSTTVTSGYFKDLNFLISSQHTAQNTLQLLCLWLALISHA